MKFRNTVYNLFEERAIKYSTYTALVFEGERVTYKELMERVDIIALSILEQAFQEHFIGISTTKCVDMIAGLLAIQKAGKAYLPLDPAYPKDRLLQLVETAQLKFTLCQNSEQSLFTTLGLSTITCADTTTSDDCAPPFYNDIVCVLFTSGSTGVPKGVCLGQKGLLNQLERQQKNGMALPGTRTLQYSHLSFDAAFTEIFVPLVTGGTLHLINDNIRLNAGNLLHFVVEQKIERLFLSYAVIQFLAEIAHVHNKYPTSVKEIITGGELLRITPAIANLFTMLPECVFMNVYGPTETSVWVTELKLKGNAGVWPAIPSLGVPIDGVQLFLTDSNLQPVADGETGEVLIQGDCVALGYLNKPELTKERFIECIDPVAGTQYVYRTGDLASKNEDGTYQFRGRADSQVKIRGGHRVELSEIEVVIGAIAGVSQVKVIVREHVPGDRRIVGYAIVTNKGITEKQIISAVGDKLPGYMLPDRVVLMNEFPFTVSGKIDARALPKPEQNSLNNGERTVPANNRETFLRDVWEEILQVKNISVTDNFFDLGGNSLAAIRLMIKIEKEAGKQLPLVSVFEHPTIEQLAVLIDQKVEMVDFSPLVQLKDGGNKVPVYLIHGDNLNVIIFRPLAEYIDAGRPVYGLQAKGIDNKSEPLSNIEEIAAYYNKAIIHQNPSGPYAIIGYSFGGYLAVEMAQQLQQMGKEVILLGMLDSDASFAENHTDMPVKLTKKVLRQFPKILWISKTVVRHPVKVIRYQWKVTKERIMGLFSIEETPDPTAASFIQLMNKINAVHHKALSQYRLKKYDGRIVLFKAMQRPYFVDDFNYLGWKPYAHDVEVRNIPGDHSTMLNEPNCRVLAKEIDNALGSK